MERDLLPVLVFHYSRVKMNKIEEQTFQDSIKTLKRYTGPTVITNDFWEEFNKMFEILFHKSIDYLHFRIFLSGM